MLNLIALLITTTITFAQVRLPVTFDMSTHWQPRPDYLGNPASEYTPVLKDGAVCLQVSEAGKGMRYELQMMPFDQSMGRYLLIEYKAENLGPGYAIHLEDNQLEGSELLKTDAWEQDGNWHYLAVDFASLGSQGAVKGLLTEVQCTGTPAFICFKSINVVDDLPDGVKVFSGDIKALPDVTLHPADFVANLKANPGWLAAPAEKFGAEVEDGILHLWAEGNGKGMKWSVLVPEPLKLAGYRWVTLRYKAKNILPWSDYAVWLGSGPGGAPDQWAQPFSLTAIRAEDRWLTTSIPLSADFTLVDLALQVSSAGQQGDIWFDSICFSANRPKLPMTDTLPYTQDDRSLRLPVKSAYMTDLSVVADTKGSLAARMLHITNWMPQGRVNVLGIPFRIADGEVNTVATSLNISNTVKLPIGQQGSEAYVLMGMKLPVYDLSGLLGQALFERTTDPERFTFMVEYDDGVVDYIFPVNVLTGQYEITQGMQVACLAGLRNCRIRNIGLYNRMETGTAYIAAVTLNRGRALTAVPKITSLPESVPPRSEPKIKADIRVYGGGYELDNGLMMLRLRTQGGIEVVGIENRCTRDAMTLTPGPLFELGQGDTRITSNQVRVGNPQITRDGTTATLTIPIDGHARGVEIRGDLVIRIGAGPDIEMSLNLINDSTTAFAPQVSFPLMNDMKIRSVDDTWYLWAKKGGVVSNQPVDLYGLYGGQYPLQVANIFSPKSGGGLAWLTYDQENVYRYWHMLKNDKGVTWRMDYVPHETQPGERIETVPTALRAHTGDWRTALGIYHAWAHTWYKPQVERKPWFQGSFYYQQVFAWSQLYDPQSGAWKMDEVIKQYRDTFGRLDYLHIFDFGESRVYGRVGDYNHYEELGGLETMRNSIKKAQDDGVRVGLYIEGYLCDIRGEWGKEGVPKYGMRNAQGDLMEYSPGATEYMMCVGSDGWRNHLADTYKRVAGELQPDGMYIDQFGFIDAWKTCYSRDHGHPVPWPPIKGERDTLKAIRQAVPEGIVTITEEMPNDFNTQFSDGALAYSVCFNDPALSPHRVNFLRFMFPDFKAFELTAYNPYIEGGWTKLKFPFFNGEGYWQHQEPGAYCEDAKQFLTKAFKLLNDYEDCFCSNDVEPLVPTQSPLIYANRFTGPSRTVWTLFNSSYNTFRGEGLRVPHTQGMKYYDLMTGKELTVNVHDKWATLTFELGPRDVGCIATMPADRKP